MSTVKTLTGGMSTVSRGRFFQHVDAHLASPTFEHLEALRRGTQLFQIGLDHGLVVEGDRKHVTQDIFGEDWWSSAIAAQSEPVVRAAYIHAIEVSLAHAIDTHGPPLPIHSLWMVQSEVDVFEAHVVKSNAQVTVILVTPKPPEDQDVPPVGNAIREDAWVIGSDARLELVKNRYPETYKQQLVIEPIPGDPGSVARKMRILGF
ncbi:MAG: hypothetical protein KC560_18390 [Myxococcales bacterium]|nr:hypothetical protein [Myxococcales bacterium]